MTHSVIDACIIIENKSGTCIEKKSYMVPHIKVMIRYINEKNAPQQRATSKASPFEL